MNWLAKPLCLVGLTEHLGLVFLAVVDVFLDGLHTLCLASLHIRTLGVRLYVAEHIANARDLDSSVYYFLE